VVVVPKSILVPVDGGREARRAVRVATELGTAAGLPVELLAVVSDGDVAEDVFAASMSGSEHVTTTAVDGDDVVATLHDEIERRPEALVVLGSRARGPVSELLLGSTSEAILARITHPVLLVGPHADTTRIGTQLVAAVSTHDAGTVLAPTLVEWSHCFDVDPWFVQVANPSSTQAIAVETGTVHRLATELRAEGVEAQWDVLHGRDVVRSLLDFTASMGGGVIAVASERWTATTKVAFSSTARSLVHRSPFPVLVVPVRVAALA
jgi:nucleotide-binding universal stress UspA family protein